MKNFVQPGDSIEITAGASLTGGQGLLTGTMFGVVTASAASGEKAVVVTEGVFTLPKLSEQAWTVGALIYWDESEGQCTTVSTDNTKIGYAVEAAADPSGTGVVRLVPTI